MTTAGVDWPEPAILGTPQSRGWAHDIEPSADSVCSAWRFTRVGGREIAIAVLDGMVHRATHPDIVRVTQGEVPTAMPSRRSLLAPGWEGSVRERRSSYCRNHMANRPLSTAKKGWTSTRDVLRC